MSTDEPGPCFRNGTIPYRRAAKHVPSRRTAVYSHGCAWAFFVKQSNLTYVQATSTA